MCKLIHTKSETLSFILATEYVNEMWQPESSHEDKRPAVSPLAEKPH